MDDDTRFSWILLLSHKLEVMTIIPSFCRMKQNQFSITIKEIRSDNAQEFNLAELYFKYQIVHQHSYADTP